MKEQFQELFKIIKDADSEAAITPYKTTTIYQNDGLPTHIASKLVIDYPDDNLDYVTVISKYVVGARPKSKGSTIWTQIRMIHNADIENIIVDTGEDFLEKGRLTKQPIQRWDVV